MLTKPSRNIIAKSDRRDSDRWTPLWVHMLDTAYVLEALVCEWLPLQSRACLLGNELTIDDVICLARFLGIVHDFGKATPLFQARISSAFSRLNPHRVVTRLEKCGLHISDPKIRLDEKESYHNLAGQVLLRDFGCPKGVAAVVGAHHGVPTDRGDGSLRILLKSYIRHYYGSREDMPRWKAVYEDFLAFALRVAGYESLREVPDISETQQLLWSGLVIMADWLASNEAYFDHIDVDDDSEIYELYPYRVEEGMSRFQPSPPWQAPRNDSSNLITLRFGYTANSVQKMAIKAAESVSIPGIFILEAPMGMGKSEAAMAMVEVLARKTGAGGVFWGMPTQVTTNAIFSRLVQWFNQFNTPQSVRLVHGSAELNDLYQQLQGISDGQEEWPESELFVHSWFKGRKQALLSDFVVGTVDQLLMAGLRQRHLMLRHLGLAGKVVVIDECHAYDAYMGQYLDRVLCWLGAYKVPVVLLSATLPAQRRAEFVQSYVNGQYYSERSVTVLQTQDGWDKAESYPLITYSDGKTIVQKTTGIGDGVNVTIEPLLLENSIEAQVKTVAQIVCRLAKHGCIGIICNTVNRAQRIFSAVKEIAPELVAVLYHAGYVASDRMARETEILELVGKESHPADRVGTVIIGTQVLEQSLDLDFDLLITDLCPIDLLLQRIGRLHRHETLRHSRGEYRHAELSKPRCLVIERRDNSFEIGSVLIYTKLLLLRTREFLPKIVNIPNDISPLVQKVYGVHEPSEYTTEYQEAQQQYIERRQRSKQKAQVFLLNQPRKNGSINKLLDVNVGSDDLIASATVRDSDPGIEVLVVRQLADGNIALLPWVDGGRVVEFDRCPNDEVACLLARQRLRLPAELCREEKIEDTLRELKERNKLLSEWQQSYWLRGELFLVLDESLTAELSGIALSYDYDTGLSHQRIAQLEVSATDS